MGGGGTGTGKVNETVILSVLGVGFGFSIGWALEEDLGVLLTYFIF